MRSCELAGQSGGQNPTKPLHNTIHTAADLTEKAERWSFKANVPLKV
jgi:hypothetical protein